MASPLKPGDEDVRGALTRMIATLGFAPSIAGMSEELERSAEEIEAALLRLHAARALLLHPGTTKPWAVHPFALSPGSCWVQTPDRGYWANCLYCACGIAASLKSDAMISTRLGGEAVPVTYEVRNDELVDNGDLFHLSTPAARWWDNVMFACSTFQPFRQRPDIDDWCRRHDLPSGAVMSLPELWKFSVDWYGDYLSKPWHKRTAEEAEAVFVRNGLVGPFWSFR